MRAFMRQITDETLVASLGRSDETSACPAYLVGFVKLLLQPGDRHLHRRTVSTQQCPRIDGEAAGTDRRHAAQSSVPPADCTKQVPEARAPGILF